MNLADRLRQLADRLPAGAALMLSRDGLLALVADTAPQTSDGPPTADLTVSELGVRFHRAPSTVRQWCERGRFEGAYKLNGRDWRIPQAGVEAFLRDQRGTPPAAELGAWRAVRGVKLLRRR